MMLGYVIVYVADVSATIGFYEQAFGLKKRFVHESGAYAEMETGGTALAFADEAMVAASHDFRPNRQDQKPAGVEIGLVTDQVERQYERAIEAGAISVVAPHQKPWGQTVSYVKDINGCLVELCSPVVT